MHTALRTCRFFVECIEKPPTARTLAVDYFDGCRVPAWGFRARGGRGIVAGNMREVPMSAKSSPAQSEFYASLLPVEPSAEPPLVRPPVLEEDRFPNGQPSLRKRASRALSRFLITICIGVAATLAWQSYGDAAREMM